MAANRFQIVRRLCALVAVLLLPLANRASAAPASQDPVDFSRAQYVHILLGESNQEMGIQLLTDQPDGLTQAASSMGRQSLPNPAGSERYFPLAVNDSYIFGGRNWVTLTVNYKDEGTDPIYLEYDAHDSARPDSRTDEVVRKRVELVTRGNTGSFVSTSLDLDDARFANSQPGGGDLRIGAAGDLTLVSVSLRLQRHEDPVPPIRIFLEGEEIRFDPDDVGPVVPAGGTQTLVPFRAMFDALGARDVTWDGQTRTVVAKAGKNTIRLTVDQDVALVNGLPYPLDQPPTIVSGRVMVPLGFVAAQFGLRMERLKWDDQARLILLTGSDQ